MSPPDPAARPLTRDDLLDAYLAWRRARRGHPELQAGAWVRYRALAAAFGCPLHEPPLEIRGAVPIPMAEKAVVLDEGYSTEAYLWRLFEDTIECAESLRLPFRIYPDAPVVLWAYEARFGPRMSGAHRRMEGVYRALLNELVENIWGLDHRSQISVADARRHGLPESVGNSYEW